MTDIPVTGLLALCVLEAYLVAVLVLEYWDVRRADRDRDDDGPGIA